MTVVLIVMGVSGSGKTTVGHALAQRLDWPFFEGDDYHPQTNIVKMSSGHPLTDADREPWLLRLRELIADRIRHDQSAVLTCSALKQSYRDIVRATSLTLNSITPANRKFKSRSGH